MEWCAAPLVGTPVHLHSLPRVVQRQAAQRRHVGVPALQRLVHHPQQGCAPLLVACSGCPGRARREWGMHAHAGATRATAPAHRAIVTRSYDHASASFRVVHASAQRPCSASCTAVLLAPLCACNGWAPRLDTPILRLPMATRCPGGRSPGWSQPGRGCSAALTVAQAANKQVFYRKGARRCRASQLSLAKMWRLARASPAAGVATHDTRPWSNLTSLPGVATHGAAPALQEEDDAKGFQVGLTAAPAGRLPAGAQAAPACGTHARWRVFLRTRNRLPMCCL